MSANRKSKKASAVNEVDKLDEVIRLLQLTAAIDLYKLGVTQQQIAKTLKLAKATVNSMLKGAQKE